MTTTLLLAASVPPGVARQTDFALRFAEVEEGVFKGPTPRSDSDFQFLKAHHIRYIVQAHFLPFLSGKEKKKAREYGMTFVSIRMNASPFPPSQRHVHRILCMLHDKRLQPIYFHCDIGRDRTSLLAALYGLYFKDMSAEDAWKTAESYGFKESWMLRGLKTYFLREARQVEEARTRNEPPSSVCIP